jgi:hypothetical protein
MVDRAAAKGMGRDVVPAETGALGLDAGALVAMAAPGGSGAPVLGTEFAAPTPSVADGARLSAAAAAPATTVLRSVAASCPK